MRSVHKRRNRKAAAASNAQWLQMALPVILFGLGALVFCMLGGVYAWEGLESLQQDRFGFAIGTISGTHWHRNFSAPEHPLLFGVSLLTDATGAVGAFGIGLFMLGALVWMCSERKGPVIKKLEAIAPPWFTTAMIAFGAHFALMMVPYALAFLA